MADNNLPLQITVEQSGEKVSEQNNSGSIKVAAATALLALSLATGNPAKAEQPAQPTQLAAVTTPAASVPTAAKGYGQEIILKDGTRYTFVQLLEIGKKDPNKEDEILSQLPEETEDIYRNWRMVGRKQEVNQLDTSIAGRKQEVNQKKEQLITGYEKYVTLAEQGRLIPDKKMLNTIINSELIANPLKERAKKFL